MPIPNVSTLYKRINNGSEGGNEFARFIDTLLIAEARQKERSIISYSDASGDYKGVDAIVDFCKGFQHKFYPSPLSSKHRNLLIQSIQNGINNFPELTILTIVTPEDFMKEDVKWFEDVVKKYQRKTDLGGYYSLQTDIEHWGHKHIIELILRYPHVGKQYFPELFPYDTEKFKMINISWDKNFIFDFHFINNSFQTFLLYDIDFIIENVWSSMNGIPDKYLLKSLGTLEFVVDFNKKENNLRFPDPLIFKSKTPQRFKIQVKNMIDDCPGSSIKFKFSFNFKEMSIRTQSFIINF